MIYNLKLVKVDTSYCDYLRMFDNKVPYNKNEKELRPFIGVLFMVNDYEYFAPLSSPKPKHKTMKNTFDFFKIKDGECGAINFNNMIPVNNNNYCLIDLDNMGKTKEELKYKRMLIKQLNWLNANYDQVKNKSYRLYTLYVNKKLPKNIMDRCCNFKLLEEISKKYKEGYND